METVLMLLATIIILLLLVAIPFMKGAYRAQLSSSMSHLIHENRESSNQRVLPSCWKFDPHEEKILLHLLTHVETGISVAELNQLLKVEGKSAENQRQRRHLVIKELNTKLFVLFNIRECIVRVPEEFDSRKKQYVIIVSSEISNELSAFLPV